MPFEIVRNDITKMKVDAIVNAANTSLLGGGGVDGCIHRAAGPELLAECRTLNGCPHGSAKITKGYRLPAKYVIHTVGPRYRDGMHGEKDAMVSCYNKALELAEQYKCNSVAFPLISTGAYGYPVEEALDIATDTITAYLAAHNPDMYVYLVVFDRTATFLSLEKFKNIRSFIDDNYAGQFADVRIRRPRLNSCSYRKDALPDWASDILVGGELTFEVEAMTPAPDAKDIKEKKIKLDESFSEMLLRMIDERKMTDPECYHRANIDRKCFSKIRNDKSYKPSKNTVFAFAVALRLSIDETKEFLMKAGYALSRSFYTDVIVEAFIREGNYNIYDINEVLFDYDQKTLGS